MLCNKSFAIYLYRKKSFVFLDPQHIYFISNQDNLFQISFSDDQVRPLYFFVIDLPLLLLTKINMRIVLFMTKDEKQSVQHWFVLVIPETVSTPRNKREPAKIFPWELLYTGCLWILSFCFSHMSLLLLDLCVIG